nr:hypothetical protein [uncultured Tolumonas sp.]
MIVDIDALTRNLISQHDWIFPVVNGKRIGHEIDVSAVYMSHGIHVLQVHGTEILEVEIGMDSLEHRENLHEKIRILLEQPLIDVPLEHVELDLDHQ